LILLDNSAPGGASDLGLLGVWRGLLVGLVAIVYGAATRGFGLAVSSTMLLH